MIRLPHPWAQSHYRDLSQGIVFSAGFVDCQGNILSLGIRRSAIIFSWLRWCRLGIRDGAVLLSDFTPIVTSFCISVGKDLSYYTVLDEAIFVHNISLFFSVNSLLASVFSV